MAHAALIHRALPQKPIPQTKVGDIVYLSYFHAYAWIFSLAARAYKQALITLATLTSIPSYHSHSFDTHHQFSWNTGNSILSSILPNPQGQGPLSSALRIAIRLRHQSWLPRFLSSRLSQDSGRRRSDEELSRRAIKVMDLLQHAADLGHLDALLALGKISLVDHSSSECTTCINSLYLSSRLPHISPQTRYLPTKLSRLMRP
jgi:SEL1 protein